MRSHIHLDKRIVETIAPLSVKAVGIWIAFDGIQKRLWFEVGTDLISEAKFNKAVQGINEISANCWQEFLAAVNKHFTDYGICQICK